MSRSSLAFTTVEVLVAIAIFATITIAATGIAQLTTRIALESDQNTVALNVARGKINQIRQLPYDKVGLINASGTTPVGILPAEEIVQQNNRNFTIKTAVEFVDDPETAEESQDYKKVTIRVEWRRLNREVSQASQVTLVTPVGFTTNGGIYTANAFGSAAYIALNVPAPGVLDNDRDGGGQPLTAELVSNPQYGELTLNPNGSFEYIPDPGFSGIDSFTYRTNNGTSTSAPGTVTLYGPAGGPAPGPNPPGQGATDDAYSFQIPNVLNNDVDPGGQPLTAQTVSNPRNGQLTLNPNGTFSYLPNAGFNGLDSFTYRTNNGTTNSAPGTVRLYGPSVGPGPGPDPAGQGVGNDNFPFVGTGNPAPTPSCTPQSVRRDCIPRRSPRPVPPAIVRGTSFICTLGAYCAGGGVCRSGASGNFCPTLGNFCPLPPWIAGPPTYNAPICSQSGGSGGSGTTCLYAATGDGPVYSYKDPVTDQGGAWVDEGKPSGNVNILRVFNGTLYAGGEGGVWKYNGSGQWEALPSATENIQSVVSMAVVNGNSLYIGTQNPARVFVYNPTDPLDNWEDIGTPDEQAISITALTDYGGWLHAAAKDAESPTTIYRYNFSQNSWENRGGVIHNGTNDNDSGIQDFTRFSNGGLYAAGSREALIPYFLNGAWHIIPIANKIHIKALMMDVNQFLYAGGSDGSHATIMYSLNGQTFDDADPGSLSGEASITDLDLYGQNLVAATSGTVGRVHWKDKVGPEWHFLGDQQGQVGNTPAVTSLAVKACPTP